VVVAPEREVERVIISTAALGPPEKSRHLVRELGEQVVVGLAARASHIVAEDSTASTELGLDGAARAAVDGGVSRLIYTDVLRDGALGVPVLRGLEARLSLGVPALVAGGVTAYPGLDPLRDQGTVAVVVGRALLDRQIFLAGAIEVAPGLGPFAQD
jgi:phosphoribosylformimino-5-aminoimidazole carboxamide ribotide isomerase